MRPFKKCDFSDSHLGCSPGDTDSTEKLSLCIQQLILSVNFGEDTSSGSLIPSQSHYQKVTLVEEPSV